MNKLGKVAVALAMAFSIGAALAAPIDVYVTVSGAGDMDGRDWDNAMKSITDAYALCAANAEGGTVHLAGGFYRSTTGNFTAGAGIVPAMNVTLHGETDAYGETPVVITGDQALNDYWSNGAYNTTQIWKNNIYQKPAEGGCYYYKTYKTNDGSFCNSSADAAGSAFENLVFNGFTTYVMALSNANGVRFSKCRFLGNANSSNPVLTISNSDCTIADCEFEGNVHAFKAASADETKTAVVRNTRFNCNLCGGDSLSGGVVATGKAVLDVRGCEFRRLSASWGGANKTGGSAVSCGAASSVFSNCVFTLCYKGSATIGVFAIVGTAKTVLDGCLFLTNSAAGSASYSGSACVAGKNGISISIRARNCAFIGNKMTATGGSAPASVFSNSDSGSGSFVNCTFAHNMTTGSVSAAGTFSSWRNYATGLANCVFYNNDVWCNDKRTADAKGIGTTGAGGDNGAMIINTIFWHEADDYKPFSLSPGDITAKRFGVASSTIKNYTRESSSSDSGFFYEPILSVDPNLDSKLARSEDGRLGWGLSPWTTEPRKVRKSGIPIYLATNDFCYFLDTHKSPNVWRRIAGSGAQSLSIEDGKAYGLTLGMTPYADAFGASRTDGKIAMGALNAPTRGMMLLVK